MFEVAVGAILTQNTAWSNVEKALAALARERALDPGRIASLPLQRLEALIRPSGYFSQKADRLRRFARRVRSRGGMGALLRGPLPRVREGVLALYGVGPETADSILLYAGGRPVFVVDAYTLRIAARLGWRLGRGYEGARTFFEARLPRSPAVFAEFHALLVRFAKLYCRARPLCRSCPALSGCPTGRRRALG